MKKLFLLDAYALIYRAYYAFFKNPRINSKGLNTSAIFGFVNTLEDVLKHENPTHIAVAFDPAGKTFRHEAFEQYKAQRQKMPEDIKLSIPYIKQIIEAYGITVFQVEGFEADDVIGTLAKMTQELDYEVFMMTPDKDYGQLVDSHIFQYKPRFGSAGFDTLGVTEIKQKYDVENPAQVIDLLGLMGDISDNIPGCAGVGKKTAAKLLKEFGTIENLLENTSKIKGALKEKIENSKEQIIFSKFLATIKTDVPLDFSEGKLIRKPFNVERITKIFNELEFRTLLAKIKPNNVQITNQPKPKNAQQPSLFDDEDAFQSAPENTENLAPRQQSIQTVEHQYFLIDNDEKINDLLEKLNQQKEFCFDTETTSLNTFDAEIVGLSFAFEKGKAYFVTIPENQIEVEKTIKKFKQVFENEHIGKVGQNTKYDIMVLQNYGIEVRGKLFDTMIAHYLIQPELRHNMDYMAEIFLNYKTVHFDELFKDQETRSKSQNKGKNIRKVNLELLKDYACEDADITLQLKQIFEKKIEENSLENLFYEIEMPLVKTLCRMEQNGVLLDDAALSKSAEILNNQLDAIEKAIYEQAENNINISSPKQIGELLFDKLKIIEKPKKTKTGQYITDEETLERLKEKHPVVKLILEHRGLKKLLSTYVEALPKLINPKTGKIHTSFNQTVTATGRLSSSNPNLQNIPVRDEQGREIRKAFIAQPDCVLLAADYSQVELRIMAHLSDDKNMLDAFLSGQDIHAATAAKIYKVSIAEVTKDMRRKAKTANFGIIYGISAFGLSERLSIPRSEAKTLISEYFNSFPNVKIYMEMTLENARKNGFVQTILHRKRYLPDINSANANVRGFAERNAINAPIQGAAADIIKIAMVKIDEELTKQNLKTEMILQIHDEIVFNVPNNELETVKTLVKTQMENAVKLNVPLIADLGAGQNWLEAH
ncbi:MAG: DNA polymerase I [Prevotellaceae bacterium]|jgi:DNA polymerase-1|nr:DNA polymerase I [Prevotellaceae bacterium]